MNPASLTSRLLRRVFSRGRVVVTGGPAAVPIDQMRILTNRSSGELAIRLANALAAVGADVEAWIGAGATCMIDRSPNVQWSAFETNQDVLKRFKTLAEKPVKVAAIFHAAALSDFAVARIENADGKVLTNKKIPSSEPDVRVVLKPAPKVLRQLRSTFPDAYICGWKFEAGSRIEARQAAKAQIRSCRIDACVLNGPAMGSSFEWHQADGSVLDIPDRASVAETLSAAFASGACFGSSAKQ